ncbi:MAG: hypothetical protein H6Q60_164 [Oscillospiraceae bacterium]|nr:hypothetical protein [Oscillospiraceae bacterium]
MQRKIKKRMISAMTVLTLCVSAMSIAAPSALAYSDVNDSDLSEAVTVLSDIGIISGYPDGTYRPDNTLTRAEFSKLAIYAEGEEDQISSNAYRSYFNDISTSHWALGAINLAYSEGLVSGYGNGSFGPDDTVTCGQAVTIILRLLGYETSDIGSFWPQDYMAKAEDLGLLDGIDAGAYDALTRADAALMLYAMIQQTDADGNDYIDVLADSTVETAVLLDNDAEADDGTTGNLEAYVDGSITYYEQASTIDSSLVGLRGTILFDDEGDVMGFLPDGTSPKSVVVKSTTASKITDSSGNEYSVSASTPVVYKDEVTTYEECYYDLSTQGSVKLYYKMSGSVNLIVASSASDDGAAVCTLSSGAAGYFQSEFNIASGSYTLYKNGQPADTVDLEQYDVAVYDKATSSLMVSSWKVTGYVEDASPNMEAATSVTVLGHEFSVLDEAQDSLASFSVGDKVTLLLTNDQEVAAAYAPSTVSADTIGVLDSTSTNSNDDTTVTITLTNGIEISGTLASSVSTAEKLVGTLVKVAGTSDNEFSLSAIGTSNTSSDLDVSAEKLGTVKLAPDVKIYDQVSNSAVVEVDLDDIYVDTVDSDDIKYVGTNSIGEVNLLLLDDVTGNCYTYGFIHFDTSSASSSSSMSTSNLVAYIEYGNSENTDDFIASSTLDNTYDEDELVGLAGNAAGKVAGVTSLTAASVARSAIDSDDTVEVDGVLVPISDDVVVYNSDSESWTTLQAAKSYTSSFTVYYDKTLDTGAQIRVIVTK